MKNFWLLFLPVVVDAEVLKAGIAEPMHNNFPEQIAEVQSALESSGLSFEYIKLPPKRSLALLKEGEIALDIFRHSFAFPASDDLIKVSIPVDEKTFRLFVSKNVAYLCKLSPFERQFRTVVGVKGARIFEDFIYKHFSAHTSAEDLPQLLALLKLNRFDYGIWEEEQIYQLSNAELEDIVVCSPPYLNVKFHTYLSNKYAWALPYIEKSYRLAFLPSSSSAVPASFETRNQR